MLFLCILSATTSWWEMPKPPEAEKKIIPTYKFHEPKKLPNYPSAIAYPLGKGWKAGIGRSIEKDFKGKETPSLHFALEAKY